MRPFEVEAGEWAPDVDAALEKAKDMLKSVERDDSAIRNVHGVEETQAAHYWTNQQLPETDIESVSKKATSAENVNLIDGNPHQTGSSLAMHENNSGGNAQPSSLTKSILKTLKETCPDCGKKLEKAGAMCKEVACGESMSKAIADRSFDQRERTFTGTKIPDYNELVELEGRKVPPKSDEAPRTMDPIVSSFRRRHHDGGGPVRQEDENPREVQVMPRPSPGDTGGQNFDNPAAQGFGFEPAPSFVAGNQPQTQTSIGAPKQQQRLPAPGQSSVQTGRAMDLSWRMLKQGPLDALMGGGGPPGEGPMDDMDEGPEAGPLDDDDDAQSLATRIKDMIDDLADKAGGDKPDMPDMGDMDDDMDAGPTLKAISKIIHKGKKCPGCGKQMGIDKGMCKMGC